MLGRATGLSRLLPLQFAARIGLPERAATRTLDQVLEATASLVPELQDGALPFPPPVLRDVVRAPRNRRRALG